ncbi:MAG: hypothetical protein GF331_19050, partial [Chitinivibrionales bacterium]|nr:hypothetical protein [Chitinivibrionales bacterium]
MQRVTGRIAIVCVLLFCGTVSAAVVFNPQPVNDTACLNGPAHFASNPIGAVWIQWEGRTSGSWELLTNGGTYSGVHTAALTVDPVTTDLLHAQYRLVAVDDAGDTSRSDFAILYIYDDPQVWQDPADLQACLGQSASFTVGATGQRLDYWWQYTDDGATWNDAANGGHTGYMGTTVTLTSFTAAQIGRRYRCVVSNSACNTRDTSASATLTMLDTAVVLSDPTAVTACVGDAVSFGITAGGAGLTFQWQVQDGGTYSDLANGGAYTGATSDMLVIDPVSVSMSYQGYRCIVGGTCPSKDTSATATLTVNPEAQITQHPVDTLSLCESSSGTLTVGASGTGLGYQWQRSTGGAFTDVTNGAPYSGATSPTLSISSAPLTIDSVRYRCIVTSDCLSALTSDTAVVLVMDRLTIETEPVDVTACSNGTATFTVAAGGEGLSYQWQERRAIAWADLSEMAGLYEGTTTPSLNIIRPDAVLDQVGYRCIITQQSPCVEPDTTVAVTLTVSPEPVIVSGPITSITDCVGIDTTIGVVATGASTLTYRWQSNESGTFVDLSDGAHFSGTNSDSLEITDIPYSLNGSQIRCIVTDECGVSVISGSSWLWLQPLATIVDQPTDTAVCDGTPLLKLVAQARLTSTNHRWQIDSGTGFTDIAAGHPYWGTDTDTLRIYSITTAFNGYRYRCVLTSTCPTPVHSDTATLTVYGQTQVTAHPQNAQVCAGAEARFGAEGSGGLLSYRWQVDSGAGFVTLDESATHSGVATDTLTVFATAARMDSYRYRCVIDGACGAAAITNGAFLDIVTPPTVTGQPVLADACEGGSATYAVTASGEGTLGYRWQRDAGSGYADLIDGAPFSGATSPTLTIDPVDATMIGNRFRCIVTTSLCPSNVISEEAGILVRRVPAIAGQPRDTGACQDAWTTLTVSATGDSPQYEWQRDAGTGFAVLSDDDEYSTVSSPTLTIERVTADGYRYRCRVFNSCDAAGVISDTVTVSMLTTPVLDSEPRDTTLCEGADGYLSMSATGPGVHYTWRADTGNGFEVLDESAVFSGVETPLLTLSAVGSTLDGARFFCTFANACAPAQSTDTVTVTVVPQTRIVAQPGHDTVCTSDDTASFGVLAAGSNLTYQWSIDTGGPAGFVDAESVYPYTGATSDTFSILSGILMSMHGWRVRCTVGGDCGPATVSDTVLLLVNLPSGVMVEPEPATVCGGEDALFGIVSVGRYYAVQWQMDTGTGFTDLPARAPFTGVTTDTLRISAPGVELDGALFRCRVTGECSGERFSYSVPLSVAPGVTITLQPRDTIPETIHASFIIEATGHGTLQYQWQRDTGSGFVDLANETPFIGVDSRALHVSPTGPAMHGHRFRCVVTQSCGAPAITDAAAIRVRPERAFGLLPG